MITVLHVCCFLVRFWSFETTTLESQEKWKTLSPPTSWVFQSETSVFKSNLSRHQSERGHVQISVPSLKLTSSPLKIDGWKMTFSLGALPIFRSYR